MNKTDILIIVVLSAIIISAVVKIIWNKKKGRTCCGCDGCAGCCRDFCKLNINRL